MEQLPKCLIGAVYVTLRALVHEDDGLRRDAMVTRLLASLPLAVRGRMLREAAHRMHPVGPWMPAAGAVTCDRPYPGCAQNVVCPFGAARRAA
jgi:hypothetical protein